MSTVHHKRGRPSRAERIQIRNDLEPFFEQKVPAYKAATTTGYDTKTVNKYYDEFYNAIYGYETTNFLDRYEKERTRYVLHLENLMYKEHEMLEIVETSILESKDKGEPIPGYLLNNHSKIIQILSHLGEKKASALMFPDARDELDMAIEERVRRHV